MRRLLQIAVARGRARRRARAAQSERDATIAGFMTGDASTFRKSVLGRPIRKLHVEVVAGPDRGRTEQLTTGTMRIGTAEGNDLRLTDPTASRFHLELRREHDRIDVLDHDSTNGTRIGPVLVRGARVGVSPPATLRVGDTQIELKDGEVAMAARDDRALGRLSSRAPAMQALIARARQVASSDASLLLLGESGTGKEVLARAIHESSPRASGPFVAVDCGALSPGLFASELFGHERGAFTGADRRHPGAFERARGGTLFLDEIGELPPEIQAALLGVLERRSYRRVGGTEELEANARVLAATHRDLHASVNAGRFRLDLFHRIAVVVLDVPPLRERLEDLPALLDRLYAELGDQGAARAAIDEATMDALRLHPWPGNVRELRNFVHAAIALGEPPSLHKPGAQSGPDLMGSLLEEPYRAAKERLVETFERRYLTRLLERTRGNVRQAARVAEMNRSYLIELLAKHGVR